VNAPHLKVVKTLKTKFSIEIATLLDPVLFLQKHHCIVMTLYNTGSSFPLKEGIRTGLT
jgi:hypothetical protein